MTSSTIDYHVTLIDESFSLPDGRNFSQYAIVEKWIKRTKLSSFKLGIIPEEKIYESIDKQEAINMSHCYFKDFSLKKYRASRNLKDNELIIVNSINASHSFFESESETDFSNAHFTGEKANFAYSTFHLGIVNFEYTRCDSELNFSHAIFHAEGATFRFSEYNHGNVDFSSCGIDCIDLTFVSTNFGDGNVSFSQCEFHETNCNFQYAKFEKGNISFDRSIFKGENIDFRKVEFGHGKVDFRKVHFGNGNVNFSECEFEDGKINFRSAVFGNGEKLFEKVHFGHGSISFNDSIFGTGFLSFNDSIVDELTFINSRLGGHCDFKIKKGNTIDLSYSIIKDIIDLQSGEENVELKSLKIIGIKNMGKLFISWEQNNTFQLINSQQESSFDHKAEQFNLLKESFRANGDYESEDKAYVAFKRNERKGKLELAKKKGGLGLIWSYFQTGFEWLVFDKAGLFATSPLRVLTSMIISLIAFSLLYMILPNFVHADIVSSVDDADQLNLVQRSFYHSAITFFTIGYGDFYPSGHVRWLSAVEGWSGVFLMSYFTVAFVRKILR
ncbi:MAG: two pore domain potassium channel family protein [Bacteroidetes bacterium]|nr:MAG: two pore domain potassium channel family protein [Bacteroidota bacterium]MBL1144045.1 two pore domain potassium channel family protein [Bacteroidota bacterium]MCB0802963.1 two pore domain potassium channel family protein [Flavobacteriales bacterium]NOG56845.1 two pore domain potassium channel family protein [Bacteroidota bacterium]